MHTENVQQRYDKYNKCTRNCNALKIELLQILIHLSYGVIYLSYVCCTFSVCIKIIVQLLYKNHTIFFHREVLTTILFHFNISFNLPRLFLLDSAAYMKKCY